MGSGSLLKRTQKLAHARKSFLRTIFTVTKAHNAQQWKNVRNSKPLLPFVNWSFDSISSNSQVSPLPALVQMPSLWITTKTGDGGLQGQGHFPVIQHSLLIALCVLAGYVYTPRRPTSLEPMLPGPSPVPPPLTRLPFTGHCVTITHCPAPWEMNFLHTSLCLASFCLSFEHSPNSTSSLKLFTCL